MNALLLIREWHEQFPGVNLQQDPPTRNDLADWVRSRFPDIAGNGVTTIGLAVDCLIAAGIGRESEQDGTVYCRCSHDY